MSVPPVTGGVGCSCLYVSHRQGHFAQESSQVTDIIKSLAVGVVSTRA